MFLSIRKPIGVLIRVFLFFLFFTTLCNKACFSFYHLPADTLISGIVKDTADNPLAGVYVISKSGGSITDPKGFFKVNADTGELLRFRIQGYAPEARMVDKSFLEVILKSELKDLKPVEIFSDGYQRLPRERASGSFIKVDSLINRPVSTNILQRLQGVVPGLVFNAGPGSTGENDISIRGISTLNSDKSPLIIVDAFPYRGNINNLNPNDVASITVLKDAAAASIYGTAAGNGVIVITTKSGLINKRASVAFNTNITITDKPNLKYISQFAGHDAIEVEKFLFSKGYYDDAINNTYTFPVLSPAVEILNKERIGLITKDQAASQLNSLSQGDVLSDYEKYFYQRAVAQQYALSLSGGAEKIGYYFSAGWDQNRASIKQNNIERLTINTQTIIKPIKNLEIKVGGMYSQYNTTQNGMSAPLSYGSAILNPYFSLGDHASFGKDFRNGFIDTVGRGKLLDWSYNPIQELRLNDNTSKSKDLILRGGMNYRITKSFSSEILYQYEYNAIKGANIRNADSYFTRNLINLFTPTGSDYKSSAIPYGAIIDMANSELNSHSARGQLNYSHIWSKHNLTALAGGEIRQTSTMAFNSRFYGYDGNYLTFANVDYKNIYPTYQGISGNMVVPRILNSRELLDRVVSLYANASYLYDGRYLLTGSVRRDASNLFGVATNQKWKPLWSIGAGWNLSNESFFSPGLFTFMKLRGSYGYAGNVNNSVSALMTIANQGVNQFNLPVNIITNPPNPSLRWEQVRTINLGIDFATRNNVLSGSLEVYDKKSTDLLAQVPSDLTSGYSFLTKNSAVLATRGLDFNLTSRNLRGILEWTTTFMFSYNTDKVIKYLYQPSTYNSYVNDGYIITPVVGQSAYNIVSYRVAGLDNQGNPIGSLAGKPSTDYDAIIQGATADDLVYNFPARPRVFGSLRNEFSFLNLSLSFNILYRMGYYFRRPDAINYTSLFRGVSYMGYEEYLQRWIKPGDEMHTNIPSMKYPMDPNRDRIYTAGSTTVEKADNIRLHDIRLSYSFLTPMLDRIKIRQLQVYIYCSNLGIIWKATKYKIDPDVYTPAPRSYAVGINFNF